MADQRLKGRIAIITGASSWPGKATANKFAAAGARVVCSDLKSAGIEDQVNAEYGPSTAVFVPCDVTQEDQIQNLIQQAVAFGGRLDAIINYADIALEARYDAAKLDSFDTWAFDMEMAFNCRGVWLCCKYAVQQMLKQEPRAPNARGDRTRGWIVNSASIYGLTAVAHTPAFVPSKFAVVGMTKQMAIDYAQDKIHINALCSGFLDITRTTKNTPDDDESRALLIARHPWKSLGRGEDVADAALFLCSDESAWMTGHSLAVDGGFTAH